MSAPEAKEIKVHYSRKKALWITLGIIFLSVLLYFTNFRFFDELEKRTIDFRFFARQAVHGTREVKAPIRLLAVDERSLEEIGQWPWPRATHAKLVKNLKAMGAKAVFYDVFFPEPERGQDKMLRDLQGILDSSLQGDSESVTLMREKILGDIRRFRRSQDGDRDFSRAMKAAGNVFIPIAPSFRDDASIPEPDSLVLTAAKVQDGLPSEVIPVHSMILSIPEIQRASKDTGHIRLFPNRDGIYRAYPTVLNYKGVLIPHISLQVARTMLDAEEPVLIRPGQSTEVAGRRIPILEDGSTYINYCGEGAFDALTYSASDALKGRIPKGDLQGAYVAIGATADGLFDLRPTPFRRNSPGVEINMNILENVYSGKFLSHLPEYWKLLFILAFALAMWWLVPRLTPFQGTAVFFLLFLGYVAASCAAFFYTDVVVNVVYPLFAMSMTFVVLTTYKFRTEVKHSRYMKQMFQSMVAPKVVEEILKLPAGIELGGEEKQLTVLFSDIRGFTTYSEKHNPHDVVEILNEYLTQMTNLIFQTEGTLDKYIGDAIMAFWGAPTGHGDHAYRACSTALGMVDLLKTVLHPKWETEGKEKLEIGVGINTGPMVVGFVGSEAIKNYTLIGDAVNLGSRLEGTTKEYKVEIIIGEDTFEQVKGDMLCRELDLIRVKGKNKPIRIYELVDHRLKAAGNKEMKVRAFEEGLALYRMKRFDEAVQRFQNCLDLDPKDGPASIFTERCKVLKQNPPPGEWDGVFVMKTK